MGGKRNKRERCVKRRGQTGGRREENERGGKRDGEEDEDRREKGGEQERKNRGRKRPADPIHPLSGTSHPCHHLPLAGGGHKEGEELSTRPKHRVLAGRGGSRDPYPCFLGQLRKHSHHIWPPCPQGAGESLYLEPVPCSRAPHSCQGESRHIPAPSTTTQPGQAMLSAFIQLMQQSIQEKKIMKP